MENDLKKFRVIFGEADTAQSETIIFVDEKIGLPVRQEFYSLADGQRTLTMTVELKNLKLEADGALFTIPPDHKRVSSEEFRASLTQENE